MFHALLLQFRSLSSRLALAGGFSACVGLVLGTPFPAGLSYFGTEQPDEIPRLWAVNGAAAVVGSAGSLTLAMLGGFNVALAGGITAYGLAAVAGRAALAMAAAAPAGGSSVVASSRQIAESVSGGDDYAQSR